MGKACSTSARTVSSPHRAVEVDCEDLDGAQGATNERPDGCMIFQCGSHRLVTARVGRGVPVIHPPDKQLREGCSVHAMLDSTLVGNPCALPYCTRGRFDDR